MNIFKIEKRYGYLRTNEFIFPQFIYEPKNYFSCEHEFMAFIMLNSWFHQSMGIKNIIRNSNFAPDITAQIQGSDKLINIEIEYNAKNFKEHNHDTNYIDLIISFIRSEKSKMINNIPVWSVYKTTIGNKFALDKYEYTLDYDISYDFNKLRMKNYKRTHYNNFPK